MCKRNVDVSVVIPAYNAEDFIDKCLMSVIEQDLPSIEIIVVDDGSTDATPAILDEYERVYPSLRVYHIENGGQGLARNYGIGRATGEYVGFVDADDYVDSCMYSQLFAHAKATGADIVWSFTKSDKWTEESPFGEKTEFASEADLGLFTRELVGSVPEMKDDSILGMSVNKCIYRKSLLDEHRIRFISERIVNSEDLLFNLDALEHCSRLSVFNEAFYTICYDANPLSYSKKYDEHRMGCFTTLHSEMMDRINKSARLAGCELRADRRYIANARVCIKLAVLSTHSMMQMKRRVRFILDNPELTKVLNRFPIGKLPTMQMIFTFCMKSRFVMLLILLTRLRYMGE